MSENKIKIHGSFQSTLNACAYALVNKTELQIENPYPKLDVDFYNKFISEQGYLFEYREQLLSVKKLSDEKQVLNPDYNTLFSIDDPIALILAVELGDRIKFKKEDCEDYKRKILILRRLGFKFFEPEPDPENENENENETELETENETETKLAYDYITSLNPVKIKYNFLETNYHLAEFIAKICALFNIEIEVLSKFNITETLPALVFPFKLQFENLIKKPDEHDELQKRLARLNKIQKKSKFHYLVKLDQSVKYEDIKLQPDQLQAAYCMTAGALQSQKGLVIENINQKSFDKSLSSIFTKLNIPISFTKTESGSIIKFSSAELKSKKIDEKYLRQCSYAFAALAILSSHAQGKTILRGLPGSSSLWRSRIEGVSEILSSANIRVGEIEDGMVIEPPQEFTDIKYKKYADPYLQLTQFCAALLINNKPLSVDYFDFNKHYPEFQYYLEKIRQNTKTLASK